MKHKDWARSPPTTRNISELGISEKIVRQALTLVVNRALAGSDVAPAMPKPFKNERPPTSRRHESRRLLLPKEPSEPRSTPYGRGFVLFS